MVFFYYKFKYSLLKFTEHKISAMKKIFILSILFIFYKTSFSQTILSKTIWHNGVNREYRIYIPAIYNAANPVPLVFNFHGYGNTNLLQEIYADFKPIADTANFIIVLPNGLLDNTNTRFWNCFGTSNIDDVGFVNALIDSISVDYNINQNRIYSTGMSNGGFMSYELACNLSNRIAAIASVTGSMIQPKLDTCNALHPTPVLQIHGTDDPTVSYNGTGGLLNSVHIDSLVKHWVQFNQCSSTPIFNNVANINVADNCTAEHYVWNNGANNTTVEFFKIIGGEHSWPGSPFLNGVTNQDFKATVEIWRFFNQYTLNSVTSLNETNKPTFSIFPNPVISKKCVLNFENENLKSIFIYNSIGEKIKQIKSNENSITLEFNISGIFFILVNENNNSFSTKIIVE